MSENRRTITRMLGSSGSSRSTMTRRSESKQTVCIRWSKISIYSVSQK